jgi:putative sigma-54 modulation protein
MSVAEAIMQLEVSEDEFLAFVNEETDEVNVVFKNKEGGYGLLRRSF